MVELKSKKLYYSHDNITIKVHAFEEGRGKDIVMMNELYFHLNRNFGSFKFVFANKKT